MILNFSIILGVIFFVTLLILIVLRQRIQIAIELIKQGSKAIGQVFSTAFWPILPFSLHIVGKKCLSIWRSVSLLHFYYFAFLHWPIFSFNLVLLWFGGVACYLQSAGNTEYKIHYNSSDLNLNVNHSNLIAESGNLGERVWSLELHKVNFTRYIKT